MAKGIGLIGNFRGKFGNAVGYNLKDSNNKQTQGVRVYQPVVKNPKTYAQAAQRAKLAPINVTYRLLKTLIDRGQESKAYGNKSRLAWLRDAIKAMDGDWTEKGAVVTILPLLPLTKGSLNVPFNVSEGSGEVHITVAGLEASDAPVLGTVSAALLAAFPSLKEGDQITLVACGLDGTQAGVQFESFVIDSTSTAQMGGHFVTFSNSLAMNTPAFQGYAKCAIISREGDNGEHLRSTSILSRMSEYPSQAQIAMHKEAAIKSYMAASGATDWPEEEIQG